MRGGLWAVGAYNRNSNRGFKMGMTDSKSWYLFSVKTGKERAIKRLLSAHGLSVPLVERVYKIKANRYKRKPTEERRHIVHKSYIMVGFDTEGRAVPFRIVLDTLWVRGVHTNNGAPVRIPAKQVQRFVENPDLTVDEMIKQAKPDFELMDEIMLTCAAFNGLRGKVMAMPRDGRRAKVALQMFGSVREMEFDFEQAKKVA